jgi:glycosyl transferase, family 25
MIDVIVISMKRSTERRAKISAHLEALGIPFKIFEAIDGDELSQAERDQIAPPSAWWRSHCRRDALPGEVGCALSHINLIHANVGREFFCVLEDDAVPTPGLLQFLDENTLRALPQFDTLRLYSSPAMQVPKYPAWKLATVGNYSVCAVIVLGSSTSAQIHSHIGASKIISNITTINSPIDDILYIHPQIPGFRVLEVRPGVVDHVGADSTIYGRPTPRRSSPIAQPLEVVAHWRRRIRLTQRFIRTWVFGGQIFSYPLWRSEKGKNKAQT